MVEKILAHKPDDIFQLSILRSEQSPYLKYKEQTSSADQLLCSESGYNPFMQDQRAARKFRNHRGGDRVDLCSHTLRSLDRVWS